MGVSNNKDHTLDRHPDSDEWDECPACEETLYFKGEDPHVDEYEIYAYFNCLQEDCHVRDVVVRYQGNASGTIGDSLVRSRGRKRGGSRLSAND